MSRNIIPLSEYGKNKAQGLSSFAGNTSRELATVNAIGRKLSKGGGNGKGAHYTFSVTNATANRGSFLLCNGFEERSGLIAEGAFEGVAGLDLTASGNPHSIQMFLKYIQSNPVAIKAMAIRSTNVLQLAETVNLSYDNPFDLTQKTKQIVIGDHQNEFSVQPNIVTVNDGFIASKGSIIEFGIQANTTVTFTLYPEVVIDLTHNLAAAASEVGMFEKTGKGAALLM
jgi:hypothetical protein